MSPQPVVLTEAEFKQKLKQATKLLEGCYTRYQEPLIDRNLRLVSALRSFSPSIPRELVLAGLFYQTPPGLRQKVPPGVSRLLREADTLSKSADSHRALFAALGEVHPSAAVLSMASAIATLENPHLPPESRSRVGFIAMHVHAPLANSLGLHAASNMLGNLGLKHSDPARYDKLYRALVKKEADSQHFLNFLKNRIRHHADKIVPHYETSSRIKQPYSADLKLEHRFGEADSDPDLLNDAIAARVVLHGAQPADCHKLFRALKDDPALQVHLEDDYINKPKPNGYRSLHLTVRKPGAKQGVELQIRTQEMHMAAENSDNQLHHIHKMSRLPRDAKSALKRVSQGARNIFNSGKREEPPVRRRR